MARKSTAVAKQKDPGLPAEMMDEVLADAETGGHGFTSDDLTLPFVRILQTNSPQVDKNEGAYIEGADVGDFLNTATGNTYSGEQGICFVPAAYTLNYTGWWPRETNKGLAHDYGTDKSILEKCTRNDKNQMVAPDGTIIVTSALYFGYLVDIESGGSEEVIVSMQSTQLKKSRGMNSQIQNYKHRVETADGVKFINPRMFFHVFKFTTVPESNEHGKWMGYKVERLGSVLDHPWGSDCYQAAKFLAENFAQGKVKMRTEDMHGDTTEPAAPQAPAPGADGTQQEDLDDEIPF